MEQPNQELLKASEVLFQERQSNDEVILFLKLKGSHPIEVIKILMKLNQFGLRDAKRTLHTSPSYFSELPRINKFHDQLEEALEIVTQESSKPRDTSLKEIQEMLLRDGGDLSDEDLAFFLGIGNEHSEVYLLQGIETVRVHMSKTAIPRLEELSKTHSNRDVREAAKNALKTCRDGMPTEIYPNQ